MKELVNGVSRYRHFINDSWVDSTVKEWIEVENPATGAVITCAVVTAIWSTLARTPRP